MISCAWETTEMWPASNINIAETMPKAITVNFRSVFTAIFSRVNPLPSVRTTRVVAMIEAATSSGLEVIAQC